MPSTNENVLILTEIVKRITPRLLAVILTIALFSLSGVIVFALHKGGEVKLNGWSFSAPKDQDEMVANFENAIKQCNKNNHKKDESIERLSLRPTNQQLEKCKEEISNSVSLLKISQSLHSSPSTIDVESRIKELIIIEGKYQSYTNKFSFKLFLLENYIPQNGPWITTHFDSPEKAEAFKVTQEILRELNFYNGDIDGDRIKTREALLDFQYRYNQKLKLENIENGTNIPLLKPLGYIGFKTLEALRGWYRVNAI